MKHANIHTLSNYFNPCFFSLYTYDMRCLDTPVTVHMDHVSAVLDVDYSPTGKEFVSASFDKTIRIFPKHGGHSRWVMGFKSSLCNVCGMLSLPQPWMLDSDWSVDVSYISVTANRFTVILILLHIQIWDVRKIFSRNLIQYDEPFVIFEHMWVESLDLVVCNRKTVFPPGRSITPNACSTSSVWGGQPTTSTSWAAQTRWTSASGRPTPRRNWEWWALLLFNSKRSSCVFFVL